MIKKNLLEDIKPISRNRMVIPPAGSPRPQAEAPREQARPVFEQREPLPREVEFEPSLPRESSRYGLWYIAIACIIGLLFALSFLFEHATVTVTPKTLPVAFDATDVFIAKKDSLEDDAIIYTEMSLSGDESMKLPSTQSKNESVAATGRAVLYNAYSTAPYKLVKGTRLATPDGKIYRIDTAVTIPGDTTKGGVMTPGSVEVSITADVAGDGSNIDHSDFTIPGLAKTAQATKIYGRTKSPITGGLSGTIYSIQQDAANAALGTLQKKLKDSLVSKAKVQVPDGYVFFDGATIFETDDSVKAPYSKTQEVPLALHGTLTAYLIKEDTLVAAIARKAISQYNGESVTIPKIESLAFSSTSELSPKTDTSVSFSLAGTASVLWSVNSNDIVSSLAGAKKAQFQAILGSKTSVDKAQVVIKPFWKQSFPTDTSRITVVVEKPIK